MEPSCLEQTSAGHLKTKFVKTVWVKSFVREYDTYGRHVGLV